MLFLNFKNLILNIFGEKLIYTLKNLILNIFFKKLCYNED